MNTIQSACDLAIRGTIPNSSARRKELSRVRWVLACGSGFVRIGQSLGDKTLLVEDISEATAYDGRDSEETKAVFFSSVLKTPCVPMLLP